MALLLLVLGVAMSMMQGLSIGGGARRIRYDEFKSSLQANKIAEVWIASDTVQGRYRRVDAAPPTGGTTTPPAPAKRPRRSPWPWRSVRADFETARVADEGLVAALEARGVRFSGRADTAPWLPFLIYFAVLGGLMIWLGRSMVRRFSAGAGGVLSFGKSRGRIVSESDIKATFDDVAGVEEAKEELKEIIEFLKTPEKFTRLGAKIPKGVLLVGPPGTGKTLLARAVAGEAQVPFFSISGSEFVEMFVGVGAARVRDLFEQASERAPCIVFIDELDALGKARGVAMAASNEEREQTLNQLLVEMDGFDPNKGVIIMAATNRPEILDPALLRPGRFDRHVLVDRPDKRGREAILRVHARGVKLSPSVDFAQIAQRTPGFAGADLANVVNEAALLAARRGHPAVEMTDLSEAIDRVVAGLEKRSRIITEKEKERVAYHEVGHAVVGELLASEGGERVHKISIVPRGVAALGYTMQLPTEDRYLMTQTELEAKLASLLGGRVSEEIVFGEISTGAQNDLARATEIARAMVVDYGMSERIGPVSLGHDRRPMFLPIDYQPSHEIGDKLGDEIDQEVRRIVEQARKRARQLLEERRPVLDAIARVLIEKEYMDGDELRAMLDRARSTPPQEAVRKDAAGAA